jgi:hypothetical protein
MRAASGTAWVGYTAGVIISLLCRFIRATPTPLPAAGAPPVPLFVRRSFPFEIQCPLFDTSEHALFQCLLLFWCDLTPFFDIESQSVFLALPC